LFPAAQLVINKEGQLEFQLNQNAWKLTVLSMEQSRDSSIETLKKFGWAQIWMGRCPATVVIGEMSNSISSGVFVIYFNGVRCAHEELPHLAIFCFLFVPAILVTSFIFWPGHQEEDQRRCLLCCQSR